VFQQREVVGHAGDVVRDGPGKTRINQAGCLDRCEFGPAMVIYPEGVWYRPQSREDVDEILTVHVQGGGRVGRLMLTERDVPPPKA
jgi:(2Fe-2S) ferredoxin